MHVTPRRSGLHYAWIVLAAVWVLFAITSGVRFSFGVFIDPLVEEHGWNRGGVSFAYSLQFLAGIPVILFAGWLAERIGSRRIVIASAFIFIVGMMLTAEVTRLWQFQLYFGVLIGGLGSSVFVTLLPVLLTRWFYRKLGLAMGIMWTSLSLGPALFSPLMRWAIEDVGWSATFIIFGLIGGILMLASSFLLREHPQEKGLAPYGGLPVEIPLADTGSMSKSLGLGQVTAKTSFWALVAVHTLGCVGHSVPLAHMVSIATFAGIPGIAAAGILSMALATSFISRMGMSLSAEAKGGRFTLTLVLLLQTLPTLLLLTATELPLFYLFAILFGIGYGGEMVGFPIFNRQYYGLDAPLNSIYSYQMAGAMLGMAVGGWLGGALFDWTGAYTWSILAAVAAGFLGMIAALLLPSGNKQ
ncbi:MAG: MFS transporter [Chloroflexi bacterium]|nr:MFS transporter [Chloroflexota bacterium]